MLNGLPEHVKVVDLSADFRLRSVKTYAEWYGGEHKAPQLQKEAVYGLTELWRHDVANARLVANPGCYPTCAQLPLAPLLAAGAISHEGIIIDAKSGVSGAGRAAKEANLFCEVADGMHAYGVGSHRHMPEIEQGLSDAIGGGDVKVSFTPHLIPMSRGMQCSMYVALADGQSADTLRETLAAKYKDETFVRCAHLSGCLVCLVTSACSQLCSRTGDLALGSVACDVTLAKEKQHRVCVLALVLGQVQLVLALAVARRLQTRHARKTY